MASTAALPQKESPVGKNMDRKKETKKPSKKEKEKQAKKLASKQPGSTVARP